ncbi:MAG: type II toxin-antitoxin system VapC family toxin [Burkholderiales bacterium]
MRALFDTNILIDYLNGVAAAKTEIARYERPAISVITWIEVLAGTRPGVETETRKFLSSFERIELTEKIAERAVSLRRAAKMRVPDAIILATARVQNLLLVTRNTKDFATDEPGIRVPYRI